MGTETESSNQKAEKHWWEVANRWWSLTIKGILGFATFSAAIFIMLLFYGVLFHRLVVILPISVTKDMEEKGYTPDVTASHLRDAMNRYVVDARTSAAGSGLALHSDLPDFVVPTVGLSFEAIVGQIRTFLRIERRQNISGEITSVDQKLRLRLRKNTEVIHESREGVDAKDLEALFDQAAPIVFAATDPYFEAVHKVDENPEAARDLAKMIIADRPPSDWNVVWAHSLLGLLHDQKNNTNSAVEEYGWAFEHKPGFAIAHLNLGNVHLKRGSAYNDKGQREDAINEFRSAISEFRSAIHIDPERGLAHLNLGNALANLDDALGQTDKTAAGCEYLEAIVKSHQAVVSNPRSAAAHQLLGTALKNKEWIKTALKDKNTGRVETANCISSSVSPQGVLSYKNILNNFNKRNYLNYLDRYDTDITEYQQAVALSPKDAGFHYDLGVALLQHGEVQKSVDELKRALECRVEISEVQGDSDELKAEISKKLDEALDQVLDVKGEE
jgi:tetratricopeptide (TPR) repeat protein